MKKTILVFALAISAFSYAQTDSDGIRFGITAGVNRSGVSNAHRPSGPRYNFQAGGLALIPISKTHQLFLQPEVLYHGAGETGKDPDFKGQDGYNALYANNYISVPVYFKAYFSKKASSFFAMAGPRFNFLIDQNVKNIPTGRPWYDPDYSDPNGLNGKAASLNFAIGLGVGYSINRDFEIVIKHDVGLSNTYKGLMNELSNRNKSEQVFSVGATYIFR
ncbi:hypothetical protein ATE49_16650 [Elizabethkingia miricola]|uniref:Outer membrane protein with beta-barrel domain n=1 Tax=Elizabethkingia miricola TaxID=172045 RepID=A0ABY3NFP1_ELIMR|nr:porin family protein [Elizabethkingia miricola]OBS11112.1 hypothetical protein ATE49_16650 [Elizabethkingia miricola]TYO91804.1 outer membrane protein with beta-barrel domain [Elizabethkingia miricola]